MRGCTDDPREQVRTLSALMRQPYRYREGRHRKHTSTSRRASESIKKKADLVRIHTDQSEAPKCLQLLGEKEQVDYVRYHNALRNLSPVEYQCITVAQDDSHRRFFQAHQSVRIAFWRTWCYSCYT